MFYNIFDSKGNDRYNHGKNQIFSFKYKASMFEFHQIDPMSFTQLEAAVMPDGTIQLEWADVAERPNPQADELQKQIFANYLADPHGWFFLLGFCNKHKPLSPSLAFWRDFTGYFVEKLRLTPDIETSRDELVLPLADEDLARFRETAPLMSGGEYLGDEVFLALWALLHDIFAQRIRIFKGPVAEFIKQYSPDIHLVGRIYFHLVENKKSETPFAFLATYSTRLSDRLFLPATVWHGLGGQKARMTIWSDMPTMTIVSVEAGAISATGQCST
jgi:hypothetical protein